MIKKAILFISFLLLLPIFSVQASDSGNNISLDVLTKYNQLVIDSSKESGIYQYTKNQTLIISPADYEKSMRNPDLYLLDENYLFSAFNLPGYSASSQVIVFYNGYDFIVDKLSRRLSSRFGISNMLIVKSSLDSFNKSLLDGQTLHSSIDDLKRFSNFHFLKNDSTSFLNIFSLAFDKVLSLGINYQTILLIVLLPCYVLLFLFFKQVVGFSFAGDIFNPVAFAILWQVLGLRYGFGFILFGVALGFIFRTIYRGLYLPSSVKSGLFYSSMAIAFFVFLYPISIYFPIVLDSFSLGVSLTSVIPFILLILVTENLFNLEKTAGWKSTFVDYFEVFLISVLSYLLVFRTEFRFWMIALPELMLVMVGLSILVGRYTGLRLFEVWKFRKILFDTKEEETE